MFDKQFGLPAHPLLIHAPIVLLPIFAMITIALVIKSDWRERAGWWPVAGLFVVFVLVFSAKQSGEALIAAYDQAYGEGSVAIDKHADLAETTTLITFVWFVVFAVMTAVERIERLRSKLDNQIARQVGFGVVAVLGGLATIWLIRTGHEGANTVWGPRVDVIFPAD